MTSKILITITVNFASHRETDEEHVMHSKSDNIKMMINDETDEVMMNHFLIHTKLDQKHQWEVVILYLCSFIINATNQIIIKGTLMQI